MIALRLVTAPAALVVALMVSTMSSAQETTPGYPERVVNFTIQSGESCQDVARALYGEAQHAALVLRYNQVPCVPGAPLRNGVTLVMPAEVTVVPTARITSVNPETRASSSGGDWSEARAGQPLPTDSRVNTRQAGRAGIQFIDRTRIYLAEHTLVVIYGTAAQTRVSKTPPPRVELKSGEVQAGLAALRGDSVEVAVEGGGRVSASSRDAVVSKKGKRTNVAVFDGRASVTNAGASVDVPEKFGTRFFEAKPPEPPRPLPPAPAWSVHPGSMTLGFGGTGQLEASWQAVPKAALYRFEVARDPAFSDIVIREQVPADVLAFRAEQMPPGVYHLRVRAIDGDDFLGIAANVATTEIVAAEWSRGAGAMVGARISPSRYAILKLDGVRSLEMALDDDGFAAPPETIDFQRMAPRRLRIRRPGDAVEQVLEVQYREPKVSIQSSYARGVVEVLVDIEGVDEVDVSTVIEPQARVALGEQISVVPLSRAGTHRYMGSMQVAKSSGDFRVDVVDGAGRVIGSKHYSTPDAERPVLPAETPPPPIGVMWPANGLSARLDTHAWAPSPISGAIAGARIDSAGDGTAQGQIYASGAIDDFGLDATIRTVSSNGAFSGDSNVWFGGRYLAYRSGYAAFDIGPAIRFGFPLDDQGPVSQVEPAIAIGGLVDQVSWLANIGARIRLGEQIASRTLVDPVQAFASVGGTYDLVAWLRTYALVDAHLLIRDSAQSPLFRGGLAGGVEVGGSIFGSVGLRAAPWEDVGEGYLSGQLGLGIRKW